MSWYTEEIKGKHYIRTDVKIADIALSMNKFTEHGLCNKAYKDLGAEYKILVRSVIKTLQDSGKIYESFGSYIVRQ